MKKEGRAPTSHSVLDFILPLCVFGLFLSGFFHTVTAMTQDLGRHFLLGKMILETKSVPLTNLFSYTYPDFPFINMHWLSEVVFYLVHALTGFDGLLLFSTLTVTIAFGLLFFKSYRMKISIIPLSLTSLIYLRILFERTDIRPEIFSFLFLSLFIVILFKFRERFTWLILLLIPLELLWVNLHIYFAIGIGTLGLFCLDEIITRRGRIINKKSVVLFSMSALCILATLFNPSGLEGTLYPLNVFDNYGYTIEENQSIFFLESLGFQKASITYFKIAVVLLFLSLILNFKKTRPIDWLLAFAFTFIGASAVRNLPLFVFATFLPFTMYFSALLQKARTLLPPIPRRDIVFSRYSAGALILVLFLFQIASVQSTRTFGLGVEPGAKGAVDFMQENRIRGPIFNNFDIGSYLDYRLYPSERVFIDGRPGEYPASFFREVYIPMQESPEKFAEVEKKYHFSTIFFSHTDQTPWARTFVANILQNKDFAPIYLDQDILILVKNNASNGEIIKKFALSRTDTPLAFTRTPTEEDLKKAANFYGTTNQQAGLIRTVTTLHEKDPQNCDYLSILASTSSQNQGAAINPYQSQFLTTCR